MNWSFKKGTPNCLLLNPKISEAEKDTLNVLKTEFEQKNGQFNFFLVTSSGSSQSAQQSAKLVALSFESVLNSARRVNLYLSAEPSDHWGLVLPDFHVAGVGVRARAFLAGSQVYERAWATQGLSDWITQNSISFMSLVPTQAFDLVRENIKCPQTIKKIFIGAGVMGAKIKQELSELGWPIAETYGMTETCSMIAVKEKNEYFRVLPEVEVRSSDGLLQIKCDSLLSCYMQKNSVNITSFYFQPDQWLQTEDRVEIFKHGERTDLSILGRSGDYVKILGEGVSLKELREIFEKICLSHGLNMKHFEIVALQNERAGLTLALVVEEAIGRAKAKALALEFNSQCRPYEKLRELYSIADLPRTALGKLKAEELKALLENQRHSADKIV